MCTRCVIHEYTAAPSPLNLTHSFSVWVSLSILSPVHLLLVYAHTRVCVCTHSCVCMHTLVCVYAHTRVCVCLWESVLCICTHSCVCTFVRECVWMCVHSMHVYRCMYRFTYITHKCISYTYICMNTYSQMYTVYINMCAHINTNICKRVRIVWIYMSVCVTHKSASTPVHMRAYYYSAIRDMTPSHVTWLTHMSHESLTRDMTPSHETWLTRMQHSLQHCSNVYDMTSFVYDMTSLVYDMT